MSSMTSIDAPWALSYSVPIGQNRLVSHIFSIKVADKQTHRHVDYATQRHRHVDWQKGSLKACSARANSVFL